MSQAFNQPTSLIKLIGEKLDYSCRYCCDTTSPKATWYISSNRLTVDDYRLLMDCGWRRHGNHVYKTISEKTCCPVYTIRCNAENFRISKAQRKVLNVIRSFLKNGEKPTETEASGSWGHCVGITSISNLTLNSVASSSVGESLFDMASYAQAHQSDERSQSIDSGINENGSATSLSGRAGSSKRRRWQSRQERMMRRAEKTGVAYEDIMKAYLQRRQARLDKNKPKDIEAYLNQTESNVNAAHTLDIRLCRISPRSAEFDATFDEEYKLYYNYVVNIHKASPSSITPEAFEEFLVDSTLVNGHDAAAEAAGAPQFGSYHQQYWLDGKKLIAVGVIDLVPGCLSSVYFFYDPQYAFLNLGTFSSLREIAFVRHLQRTYAPLVPAYNDFKNFYLGYYIYSSPKMRYKAQFAPSYLVCPETGVWVPVEKCLDVLASGKYDRLADKYTRKRSKDCSASELKLQLPSSKALISALPKGSFVVESGTVITTLNGAEVNGMVCPEYLRKIREWISLVDNTATMCIDCTVSLRFPHVY